MSEEKIKKAINDRFMAFTGSTDMPTRTALENGEVETDKLDHFFKTNFIFGKPTMIGAFTEGDYRIPGEFRVLVGQKKGSGSVLAGTKADEIAAHFKRGLVLTEAGMSVKIERTYRRTGMPEGNSFYVPVSVEFWAYKGYQES